MSNDDARPPEASPRTRTGQFDRTAAMRTLPLRRSATGGARGAIRERTLQRFPTMLLGLVSVLQGLALARLAADLGAGSLRLAGGIDRAIFALQGSALFVAIVLVWVFYARVVMRFVWLPTLRDLLVPFLLGLLQFRLLDLAGSSAVGLWIALVAFTVIVVHWQFLAIVDRARREPENAEVFGSRPQPSSLLRHGPVLGTAALLLLCAGAVELVGGPTAAALGLVAVNVCLYGQLLVQRVYWRRPFTD